MMVCYRCTFCKDRQEAQAIEETGSAKRKKPITVAFWVPWNRNFIHTDLPVDMECVRDFKEQGGDSADVSTMSPRNKTATFMEKARKSGGCWLGFTSDDS